MPTYNVPFITDKSPEKLAQQCHDFDEGAADCPVDPCPFAIIRCSQVTADDWDEMMVEI